MDTVDKNNGAVIDPDGKSEINLSEWISLNPKFAALSKLITRDLNNNINTPTFSLYSKDDINSYLSNPYSYEQQLRRAVVYMYGASSHFRRLIQYFVTLSDLSYIVSPTNIDPKKKNVKTISNNYRKVLKALSAMKIRTQLPSMLTVCLREDVYYCTMWVTDDNIIFQQLPSDYCRVSSIENNVLNVTFDFSYFDTYSTLLGYYPKEFNTKYQQYKKNRTNRWVELDSPTSFCIKCNRETPDYALPPFAGILREVYDIEDYKQLRLSKTALENYAMLAMKLPMNNNGDYTLPYQIAKEFWQNLDSVLPEEVGSVLSPMDISKISFEKSNTGDTNTVADAEHNLFSAAGVSSLLFNNDKASANALLLSIKADQGITFGIVKSIEDALNRYIQSLSFGKEFKVTFLDVSAYNRKEMGDAYLKAASYGLPTIAMYAASQGLSQSELDAMSFLETDVLNLPEMFIPLQNSAQISAPSDEIDASAGRPQSETGDLTDSGEQSREDSDDWG